MHAFLPQANLSFLSTVISFMYAFSEPDLDPAPLSALTPDELVAIGARQHQGARCLLFPAQGVDAVLVNVPFHKGFDNQRRSIDLDSAVLVDMPDSTVTPLSERVHLANPYPPGTQYTLANGFCVYVGPWRGTDALPNRSLAHYFAEPYVIRGNVLVSQVSQTGVVENIDESRVSLIRHIVVSSILSFRGSPDCAVTARNYLPTVMDLVTEQDCRRRGESGISLPEELIVRLYEHLSFPSLVATAGLSIFHRNLLHEEVARRVGVLMGLSLQNYPMSVLYAFLDSLDKGKALLAGRLARNLIRDVGVAVGVVDLLCPTQSVVDVESALNLLGYSFNGLYASVYPFMEGFICDVRVFEGPGSLIYLVRCPYDTAFPTLLRGSNTSLMNTLSGTRIYSFYASLTRAGVGLVVKDDPAFALRNQDIQLQDANDQWIRPCGAICPAIWRKTIGDPGLLCVVWRNSRSIHIRQAGDPEANNHGVLRWGSPVPASIPSFLEPCWEDDADGGPAPQDLDLNLARCATTQQIQQLGSDAGGLFIYAATVVEFVKDRGVEEQKSVVNGILSTSSAADRRRSRGVTATLDDLYRQILETCLVDPRDRNNLVRY
ncbi:hypothetical protein BKA70DRAFT_1506238 [Coprinopsis sp. MPI-PUGE-AT-0042]|nr:hypothetical protein BKA70DRAFT_1506238 [Coprinopsis sp. MPI-PUGE-AT-0042]